MGGSSKTGVGIGSRRVESQQLGSWRPSFSFAQLHLSKNFPVRIPTSAELQGRSSTPILILSDPIAAPPIPHLPLLPRQFMLLFD